jgi:uncharacterized membrane protein
MAGMATRDGVERLAAFSDGVIAILVTIMVLDLHAPHGVGLAAMWPLWPTLVSYVLSFLFVCIGWVNHSQLLRQVERVSPGLIWSNMAFLFTLSLIPFGTAYMAEQRLAPFTVAVYAFIFLMSTVAFIPFEAVVARQNRVHPERAAGDRRALVRNGVALVLYAAAIPMAYWSRWGAFAMIVGCSLLYFAPERIRRWG